MCQANSEDAAASSSASPLQSNAELAAFEWTSEMKSAAMQDAQNVCDLAMLVTKFIRRSEKGLPLDDLCEKAKDFLTRKGLNGSPLRAHSPSQIEERGTSDDASPQVESLPDTKEPK